MRVFRACLVSLLQGVVSPGLLSLGEGGGPRRSYPLLFCRSMCNKPV